MHEVGDKAKAMVVEFLEANKHTSNPGPRLVARWSPPPENCYKINFDAALFDHLGYAGIGVVVRDHRGEVMAALSQKIALPQSVWRSEITLANLYTRKHRSFFDLLDDVMQNSSGYHVALFSTIEWSLWQRRNRLRENQGTWPLHEVGERAKAMVVEFLEANKHISNPGPRLVARWSPPPESCY